MSFSSLFEAMVFGSDVHTVEVSGVAADTVVRLIVRTGVI